MNQQRNASTPNPSTTPTGAAKPAWDDELNQLNKENEVRRTKIKTLQEEATGDDTRINEVKRLGNELTKVVDDYASARDGLDSDLNDLKDFAEKRTKSTGIPSADQTQIEETLKGYKEKILKVDTTLDELELARRKQVKNSVDTSHKVQDAQQELDVLKQQLTANGQKLQQLRLLRDQIKNEEDRKPRLAFFHAKYMQWQLEEIVQKSAREVLEDFNRAWGKLKEAKKEDQAAKDAVTTATVAMQGKQTERDDLIKNARENMERTVPADPTDSNRS